MILLCDLYWSTLTSHNKYTLQKIQNSYLRFIHNLRKFDHITGAFKNTKWLNLEQRYKYHLSCLVYRINMSKKPEYLYAKLIPRSDIHVLNTRYRGLYDTPRHKTAQYEKCHTTPYNAINIYNDLPTDIKKAECLYCVKKRVKAFLGETF